MIKGHGGNIYDLARELGCRPSDIVDMSSNVNPVGPPPGLLTFLKEHLDGVTVLPEVDAGETGRAFAERNGLDPACVLAGNGTTQFIYSLPRALAGAGALILGPTYADYADACIMNGVKYRYLIADEEADFVHDSAAVSEAIQTFRADLVFTCNPNNPTGVLMPPKDIVDLCKAHPRARFVVDESYLGFVPGGDNMSLARQRGLDNVIVLNSLSKLFRIPGLRIGFVVSCRPLIDKIASFSLPWSVNSLSQTAVAWLMRNETIVNRFVDETAAMLAAEKRFITGQMKAFSRIFLFPSTTSFILAVLEAGSRADEICRYLERHKILIRNCANFHGLSSRYIRFSLKSRAENSALVEKLRDFFK